MARVRISVRWDKRSGTVNKVGDGAGGEGENGREEEFLMNVGVKEMMCCFVCD